MHLYIPQRYNLNDRHHSLVGSHAQQLDTDSRALGPAIWLLLYILRCDEIQHRPQAYIGSPLVEHRRTRERQRPQLLPHDIHLAPYPSSKPDSRESRWCDLKFRCSIPHTSCVSKWACAPSARRDGCQSGCWAVPVQVINEIEAVVSTPLGNILRPIWNYLMTSGTAPAAAGAAAPAQAQYGLRDGVRVIPYAEVYCQGIDEY
jgi:hypothetical protein